jgi:TIR domain
LFQVQITRDLKATVSVLACPPPGETFAAGRIYDRLCNHFGAEAVFMDMDTIPFGVDFRAHVVSAVDKCGVFLAVIGPNWAGEGVGSRRLEDPRDFVRIEVEAALERDLPVIPILIDRTTMPGETDLPASLARLAYRNAIDVDQGRDFHPHVDRLIEGIERLLPPPEPRSPVPAVQPRTPWTANPRLVFWTILWATAGAVFAGLVVFWLRS